MVIGNVTLSPWKCLVLLLWSRITDTWQTDSWATAKKSLWVHFLSLHLTCSCPPPLIPLLLLKCVSAMSFPSLCLWASVTQYTKPSLNQSSEPEPRLLDWDVSCSQERWSGWRKEGEGKRLTRVQLHLNQPSEPESRSALSYFLNRLKRSTRQGAESGTKRDWNKNLFIYQTDNSAAINWILLSHKLICVWSVFVYCWLRTVFIWW